MTNPNLTVFNIMEEEHLTKRRLGCEKVEKRKKEKIYTFSDINFKPLIANPKVRTQPVYNSLSDKRLKKRKERKKKK